MATRVPDGLPRVELADLPTPLHPLPRLSEELGVELWAKRDDVGGLGLGGNKLRKLEFILGDAQAQGHEAVVTFGALQSNHARQTAAACARLGLRCHLVLTRSVPRHDEAYTRGGNIALDHLFGATVHVCDDTDAGLGAAVAGVERELDGTPTRWIPPGGSEPHGVLGYVAMATELAAQCASVGIAPSDVVVASSTGGTQAGLVLGSSGAGGALGDATVRGVAVYRPAAPTVEAVELLVDGAAQLLGVAELLVAGTAELLGVAELLVDGAVQVSDRWFGPGYGVPTPESREALSLFARFEGIALDPVYTAKAAAALVAGCREGQLAGPVVFVHTGGTPALFAYGDDAAP